MRRYDFERPGRPLQSPERIFRSHVDEYHEIRPAPPPEPYPTVGYPPARYEEPGGSYLPYEPGPESDAQPSALEDIRARRLIHGHCHQPSVVEMKRWTGEDRKKFVNHSAIRYPREP